MEIKNNKLIIGDKTKNIEEINIIKAAKGGVYLSNNIVDFAECDLSLERLHEGIVRAGFENFHVVNNMIINIENIESMHIKYYQYAGISIYQSSREHSEFCLLNLVCRKGKIEVIPCSTPQEAEHWHHEIDTLVTDYKNKEVAKHLMGNL